MSKAKSKNYIKSKLAQLHQQASICHHEAGHVLLGLLNFMHIELVKITLTDNGFEGDVDYSTIFEEKIIQEDNSLVNFKIHSEILMLYAGLAAEKILFKENSGSDQFPMVLKNGCEFDMQQAYSLIKTSVNVKPGAERYLFKKQMIKRTSKILQENWGDIKIISHALFKKNKLSFLDLKKLLTSKSKNKDFWKNQFKIIASIFNEKQDLDIIDLKFTLGIA